MNKQYRVLLVCEDDYICNDLEMVFEIENYDAITTQSVDCLDLVDDVNPPDVVVTYGFSIEEKLPLMAHFMGTIPMVIITVHDAYRNANFMQYRNVKGVEFITRPFMIEELLHTIRDLTRPKHIFSES